MNRKEYETKTPGTTPMAVVTTLRHCRAALLQYSRKARIQPELIEQIIMEINKPLSVLETLQNTNVVFSTTSNPNQRDES